jgi:hypothetical protein
MPLAFKLLFFKVQAFIFSSEIENKNTEILRRPGMVPEKHENFYEIEDRAKT